MGTQPGDHTKQQTTNTETSPRNKMIQTTEVVHVCFKNIPILLTFNVLGKLVKTVL